MEPIKDIVSGLMGKMSSGTGGTFQDIQAAWQRISGDKESRVADFKDGTVTVAANSSMRLARLNLRRDELLKELKKQFPAITRINFKAGAFQGRTL